MPLLPSLPGFSQRPAHWSPYEHPGWAALLLSAYYPHSDPLNMEVRPCHSPASQALSVALRAPYSPGSFSSVSYHGPAQDTSPPPSWAGFHLRALVLVSHWLGRFYFQELCMVFFPSSFRSWLKYHLVKRLCHLE